MRLGAHQLRMGGRQRACPGQCVSVCCSCCHLPGYAGERQAVSTRMPPCATLRPPLRPPHQTPPAFPRPLPAGHAVLCPPFGPHSANGFGAAGAVALAAVLEHNTSLAYLKLRYARRRAVLHRRQMRAAGALL
jgi:hypothetical protein